jgi:threonine dehydrogenase-like Zn-dependent dehydrogenase
MRALVNTRPNRLELRELPTPRPGSGEVLIRTGAVGICATDLQMLAGWDRTGYPAIPGHEWAGQVEAVGPDVDPRLVGLRCVGENILAPGIEVGFERPGGYAEFFLTQAARLLGIEDVPWHLAVLAEPLAVCLRGLWRLGLQDRGSAAVLGDGPIGLLMVATLRRAGVHRIVLVGGRAPRLEVAESLGACATLDYHATPDVADAFRHQANLRSVPNVVEASGTAYGIDLALRLAANEGRVLILGDYEEARADFPWNEILHRELALIGSNAGTGAWDQAAGWIRGGDSLLAKLVTHRFRAESFQDALATVRDRASGAIKVVLEW